MRIYTTIGDMLNETARDLLELGVVRKTKTMQDKNIENDPNYVTKELSNFSTCITNPSYTSFETAELFQKFSIGEDAIKLYQWVESEFYSRIDPELVNPGKAHLIRKELWEPFLIRHKGRFAYTYNERIRTQLPYIMEVLGKDPWSRQCVLSIWDPHIDAQRIGRDRVPCSLYYHFIATPSEKGEPELNLVHAMRSCDFVTHFLCDIFMAQLMLKWTVMQIDGINMGKLFFNTSSLHYYMNDESALKKFMETL